MSVNLKVKVEVDDEDYRDSIFNFLDDCIEEYLEDQDIDWSFTLEVCDA